MKQELIKPVFRIRIAIFFWLNWIRIRFKNADRDPDQGGARKLTKIYKSDFPAFQNGFYIYLGRYPLFYDILPKVRFHVNQ
jgi:hypothetical protein